MGFSMSFIWNIGFPVTFPLNPSIEDFRPILTQELQRFERIISALSVVDAVSRQQRFF